MSRGRWGTLLVVGGYALCPCHLPLTLAVLSAALGGTAAGALLRDNLVVVGLLVTAVWGAVTWRGIALVRQGGACRVPRAPAARPTRVLGPLPWRR